jgi:hypothetical protein
MEKIIEENLDRINSLGGTFGEILGKVFRFIIKHAVASIVLALFGTVVFIYAIIDGARKKK